MPTKVELEAVVNGCHPPQPRTLARYGLTAVDWCLILKRQNWQCPLCGKGRGALWNIDHEHVAGWAKMPDEERVKYVRGILCFHCNKYKAPSRITGPEAGKLSRYIKNYERRRNNALK